MEQLKAFWRRIKFIVTKELLATINDPKTKIILIMPVILQSVIFGYGATFNLDNVPYAVLDQSHSKYSSDFLAHLDGTGIFERTQTLANTSQIADSIDTDAALIVLSIEPRFADKIAAGDSAEVQVIMDGRNSTTAGVASGYVSTIVSDYNRQLQNGAQMLEVQSVARFNPNLLTRWMFMPSMVVLLSFSQVMMLAGLSVAREREQGTFDQLLVTPLSPKEILIGKAIPPIIIGMIQSTFVLLIAVLWFEVPFSGSFIDLFITLLIFLISVVGIGLSISAVSSNMQQVMVYNLVIMMPMNLLSGLTSPVRNMPEILQYFTYINPLRFAIDSIRRIYLEGCGLSDVAINLIPLIIIASITMPIAGWLFRHKLS